MTRNSCVINWHGPVLLKGSHDILPILVPEHHTTVITSPTPGSDWLRAKNGHGDRYGEGYEDEILEFCHF